MASKVADTRAEFKRRIVDRIERVDAETTDNPVGVLARRFEDLHSKRQAFHDEAKAMAELVIPGMYEGTAADPFDAATSHVFGQTKFETANQSLIAKGILLLSWTMANVMLPADGDYFGRNIEASIAAEYEAMDQQRQAESKAMGQAGDPPDFVPIGQQINNELLRDDIIVRKQIAASNHQEVLARCQFHSLISGISVFGHLTLGEAKAYTIQNSICVFDSMHDPVETIVVDRMPITALPDTVRKTLLGTGVDGEEISTLFDEQFVTIYTQQVRISPTELAINTEIEGLPIEELSFNLPIDAPILIPIPFMFVNEADPYPIGWLTYNRGDLFAFENLCLSIEAMVAAASVCLIGNPPGAKLTSEELRNSPGLSVVPISDSKQKLEAIVAPIHQNLQQMLGWHDKKERQIMMMFGMDFAVQRPGERVTAEEIQVLAAGLQKLFGATYKQNERGWQHRHCRRQFYLCEEAKLIRPVDRKMYTLSLTAGLQTAEAQNAIAKMDGWLARALQFANLRGAGMTKVGDHAGLDWYAQKQKLDVKGILLTPEEEAEQMGVSELLFMIRQMGPQGPQMVSQMLQQVMQQNGETGNGPAITQET